MTAAARTDAYPDLDRDLRFVPLGVDEPKVLTRADIDRYNAKGFLFPFDVFDADEIGAIRMDFDDLLERALDAGWDSYEMTNWHKTCRVVWDLVTHPRLVAFASDLLGEVVICRHSHFFCKLPGDGKRVSWHQDASYWPLSPSKVVSIWLAIDDSTPANGALPRLERQVLYAADADVAVDLDALGLDEEVVGGLRRLPEAEPGLVHAFRFTPISETCGSRYHS